MKNFNKWKNQNFQTNEFFLGPYFKKKDILRKHCG